MSPGYDQHEVSRGTRLYIKPQEDIISALKSLETSIIRQTKFRRGKDYGFPRSIGKVSMRQCCLIKY